MMWRVSAFTALLSLLAAATGGAPAYARDADRILVFAAASLSDVMEEAGEVYQAQSGDAVTFSFAGSMTLARQIEASAGPDIFISADLESMDYLEERGLIAAASRRDILGNDLVLIAPAVAPVSLAVAPGFALRAALGGGRLAVANTETVPAGRYARAALESLGVWRDVAGALAEAEDVRAALAFVARGEAPLGIVYATDAAIEPRVLVTGRFPAGSHPPIRYPAALTAEAQPRAQRFLDFLHSDAARQIFTRAGFAVPDR